MKTVAPRDRSTMSSTFTYIAEASHQKSYFNRSCHLVLLKLRISFTYIEVGSGIILREDTPLIKVHIILISLTKGIHMIH